jgi:F-type H+-transporting ATPase subunit b
MNFLILATETGAEEASGLDIILPAPAELVYGAISFLIVFLLLKKFAFPMMDAMLEERRAAIQGKLEESDRALAEAERVKATYSTKIDEARTEANTIIEDAKGTAEALRRDVVAKAEAEAQAIVARAQAEVSTERDRALSELRSDVGILSVELASKIVEKELDASAHQTLVDEYIARLSNSN